MANPNYDDTIVVQDRGNSDFLAGLIASGANQRGLDAGSVLAMYVKDVIDDEMAGDGEVMRCWDAEMTSRGIPVEWEEML